MISLDVLPQRLQLLIWVDERQVGGRLVTVDDQDLFAQGFQDARHPQFAPQGVAVRANVTGEQKPLTRLHEFDKSVPSNGHNARPDLEVRASFGTNW